MSFIPKISIGLDKSRSTFNLGQDTHTTAEIGYIQPTFCRYIVPGSHMDISSRSIVRLSPMAVPTMGRLSLRNYYYFVDMATLWTPFDSFRNATSYTYGNGITSSVQYSPYFTVRDFFYQLTKLDSAGATRSTVADNIVCTVYVDGTVPVSATAALQSLKQKYGATYNNPIPFYPCIYSQGQQTNGEKSAETDSTISLRIGTKKFPQVTPQSADFAFYGTNNSNQRVQLLCKLYGPAKRLRKIFVGAGYSFNPFDIQIVTPFKLLAIYKAWFDTFAVTRTKNWYHTNAYKLIQTLSNTYPEEVTAGADILGQNYNDSSRSLDAIGQFIGLCSELADMCYTLPADYFSASDMTAQRGATSGPYNGNRIFSYTRLVDSDLSPSGTVSANANYQQTPVVQDGTNTALGNQLAKTLLRFINKRSVVGQKLSELLKLNGEIDLHNNEHEHVHHLGDDKTDINISDVMSLASTQDAALGDYAGRGVGMGSDDHFSYDTKAYGILICLSAIVPKSGYFQGILKENTDIDRFDYFTDEFDALGYQSVDMNELVSDSQFATSPSDPNVGTELGSFGLAPRYQHLKVGRNIVNGDMSLPSLQDVMLPYSLDRHFVTRVPLDSSTLFGSISLPTNTPETFRQIKANDGYGDYNRIFQYTGSDYDHFIIQMVFDAKVTSPMKSISQSYDTFDEDNDNTTMEVGHE